MKEKPEFRAPEEDCSFCDWPHGERGYCPSCKQCCWGAEIPVPDKGGDCVLWWYCDDCRLAWPGRIDYTDTDVKLRQARAQLAAIAEYTPVPGNGPIEVDSVTGKRGWLNPDRPFIAKLVRRQMKEARKLSPHTMKIKTWVFPEEDFAAYQELYGPEAAPSYEEFLFMHKFNKEGFEEAGCVVLVSHSRVSEMKAILDRE
jgi:hypothetical protein